MIDKNIEEAVNAMMLQEIQDIIERQENAFEKYIQNLEDIHSNYEKEKKEWELKWGKIGN